MQRKFVLAGVIVVLLSSIWVIRIQNSQLKSPGFPDSRDTMSGQSSADHSSDHPLQSGSESREKPDFSDQSRGRQLSMVFGTSIKFFGKVIDQNGIAVEGARVRIGAADRFWEDGTDYFRESDGEGLFSIQEIKGAGIYVTVEKEGYNSSEKSKGRFGYGLPSGQKPYDDPSDPAVFVLQEKGECEPLIYWEIPRSTHGSSWVQIPDGGSAIVDLKSGNVGIDSTHSIVVSQSNARMEAGDHGEPYDWSFEVKVPGGGIQLKNEKFDFHAPEDGYSERFSKSLSKVSDDWSDSFIAEYFIRFADGTYARIHLDISTYQFIIRSSYLNPTGSRNLEYDPSKRIK